MNIKTWTKGMGTVALAAALLLAPQAFLLRSEAAESVRITPQYSFGGAVTQWYAEESYYASPVVCDLDGDGKLEVINAAYGLVVMDAATGAERFRVNAGYDRNTPFSSTNNAAGKIYCTPQVKDIDGDGKVEIIVGYENGTISVLDANGYFKAGWPQKPSPNSVRSLRVEDLNHDGRAEIIVGLGISDIKSVWVYQSNGQIAAGWPQLQATDKAYGYGIFANSIALGNLDADADLEIIVPTDTSYIGAFNYDGSVVPAHAQYGGRAWGRVALYENYSEEIACENEGWGWPIEGGETREQLYRAELGHSAAVYADVDGDGKGEVVVTALIADRTSLTQTNWLYSKDTRYMTAFILNQDRSRYSSSLGFDWTNAPRDLGMRLRQNHPQSVAGGVLSEPVVEDLDGDGKREILFNSYNGKLHCISLDGKEKGAWPYTLPQSSSAVYEYATPPTCVDLNGDGKKEVIFASWTDNESSTNTGVNGALYITDYQGKLLASQPLPNGYATYEGVVSHANGVTSAPTVRDVDGDGKLEILLNTNYLALCVYEVNSGALAPITSKVPAVQSATLFDGKEMKLNAYLLDDSNYIMLRDVAYLLKETPVKFSVDWMQSTGITIAKGANYVPVGGELQGKGTDAKPYTAGTASLNINGVATVLSVCTVEGNNYFKLRDLGKALGFNVSWDEKLQSVVIESGVAYTGK